MDEVWRPIPESHFYEVSNFGRVRRAVAGPRTRAGRIMTGGVASNGYLAVTIRLPGGGQTTKSVHTLVCRAFHGEKPSAAHQAAHRDGNKANNASDNLRWATPAENCADTLAHGNRLRGSAHYKATVTEGHVLSIRRLLKRGDGPSKIAPLFGVSVDVVSQIHAGKTWAWLPEERVA